MKFNDLSIQEKAAVIKLGVGGGLRSLLEIRLFWDDMPDDPPVILKVNKSHADFVLRLKDPNREYVRDWENPDNIATHKMSWADDGIVYPLIQNVNGRLVDFSRPPYSTWAGYDNAVRNGDTIHMTPEEAEWFTTHYKDYYPGFNKYSKRGILYPDGGDAEIYYGKYNNKRFKTQQGINDLREWISAKIMSSLSTNNSNEKEISFPPAFTQNGGTALASYLLSREPLRDMFLRHGYIQGKNKDYGFVRNAVGNRDIPVYQTAEDANVEEGNLINIGWKYNNDESIPEDTKLFHAGYYPTATYIDGKTGLIYLKSWDLNNYYNPKYYKGIKRIGSKILDLIGSPVVITTGYLDTGLNVLDNNWKSTLITPQLNSYLNNIGMIKDEYGVHLPEVIVTPNEYKKGGSIHIKPENRGKFTALKKRTGHSATWFKAHGTSALKKMATFALNSRHWNHKHPDGGSLFDRWRQYMQNNTIDVPMTFRLPEVLVTAQAPRPGDVNYDKYIANTYDAWKRGDVDINTLPTETRNRVRGYSGTIAALHGMDEAAKVAGITAAIPASIIGLSMALPKILPIVQKVMNNPIVDATLTTHGIIKLPENIKEGIEQINENNYGKGVLNLGLSALDLLGAGNLTYKVGRMANPVYRAKHAYNSITPAGYHDFRKRSKQWLKDMWNNPDIDYKNPKWYLDLQNQYDGNDLTNPYRFGYTGTAPLSSEIGLGALADRARIDAWAIYNRIPLQYNTYIKNADGTYSYNLDMIDKLTEGKLHVYTGKENHSEIRDFITGAHGGLEKFVRIKGDDYSKEGITLIEDTWDLQPFKDKNWDLSRRLSDILVLKKLIPKKILHDIATKNPYAIKEIDGSPDWNFFPRLGKLARNFEVGKISGGKPFFMHTEIPWYIDKTGKARLNLGNYYNIMDDELKNPLGIKTVHKLH